LVGDAVNTQLQDPKDISLAGSTRNLLSQVTEAIDDLNELRPFSPDIVARLRTSLLPD
jgi:hypothetical protein